MVQGLPAETSSTEDPSGEGENDACECLRALPAPRVLRPQARNRNPDEFYYKMVNSKLKVFPHVLALSFPMTVMFQSHDCHLTGWTSCDPPTRRELFKGAAATDEDAGPQVCADEACHGGEGGRGLWVGLVRRWLTSSCQFGTGIGF